MFIGLLPLNSWLEVMFSIPFFIIDIVAISLLVFTVYFIGYSIPFFTHLICSPLFFLMGIFGEIALVPLALFAPFIFLFGLGIWLLSDLFGANLESGLFLILINSLMLLYQWFIKYIN